MSNVQGPGSFHARECDVSKESNVIRVFDYIKKTFTTPHVLVNNAGIARSKSIDGKSLDVVFFFLMLL